MQGRTPVDTMYMDVKLDFLQLVSIPKYNLLLTLISPVRSSDTRLILKDGYNGHLQYCDKEEHAGPKGPNILQTLDA